MRHLSTASRGPTSLVETSTVPRRVFLVGCPRSGTTLLQSLLAANSNITSFPETHFFEKLFGRPLLKALGVAGRRARPHWTVFLEAIGHPEMGSFLPRGSLTVRRFTDAFVSVLDTVALNQGKRIWLEKTPGHLRFVDSIEKLVAGARFVHILRNGLDTIGSMYEVGQQYPERWGPSYNTLDKVIQRWVVDARLSKKYALKENHCLVKYEQLIAEPRATVVNLCKFLDVPFEEQMLTGYRETAAHVILKWEPWKAEVRGPIRTVPKSKVLTRLDEKQRQYVVDQIPQDLSKNSGAEGTPCD